MKYSKIAYSVFFFLLLPLRLSAQWSVGLSAGVDKNFYSIDNQANWRYSPKPGFCVGVFGQYAIKDWLGLRAELNLMTKNQTHQNVLFASGVNNSVNGKIITENYYFQLPVLLSPQLCFWKKVKLFANLGVYGGYWAFSNYGFIEAIPYSYNELSGNSQRIDYGLIGGVGLEYCFIKHLACQVEARSYYSTNSFIKNESHIKSNLYNTTNVFQMAFCYYF